MAAAPAPSSWSSTTNSSGDAATAGGLIFICHTTPGGGGFPAGHPPEIPDTSDPPSGSLWEENPRSRCPEGHPSGADCNIPPRFNRSLRCRPPRHPSAAPPVSHTGLPTGPPRRPHSSLQHTSPLRPPPPAARAEWPHCCAVYCWTAETGVPQGSHFF